MEDRDAAYTRLCEAVTAAGVEQETQFLARLCLLLMEACADLPRVEQAIRDAGSAETSAARRGRATAE